MRCDFESGLPTYQDGRSPLEMMESRTDSDLVANAPFEAIRHFYFFIRKPYGFPLVLHPSVSNRISARYLILRHLRHGYARHG